VEQQPRDDAPRPQQPSQQPSPQPPQQPSQPFAALPAQQYLQPDPWPLFRVTRRIRDRLRRQERASEWPLMPTVRWQDKAQVLRLRRSRWQDKAQVVSLRRSRLEHAAVEVAVVFRTPGGRYVHRRMRCSGSDLKSGLGHLFDPNPETLAYAGEPSCPRAVEDHSFESADQALEAALAQDPPAHPGKWRSPSSDKSDKWRPPSSFWAFFDEELETKVEPEAARIGILGRLVAGVAFLAVLAPLLYVVWFLPAWLGIADAEEGWGLALFGLAITPAIFAAHFIADAFRRRNLAKEKNR
jgi:hypothetical protein